MSWLHRRIHQGCIAFRRGDAGHQPGRRRASDRRGDTAAVMAALALATFAPPLAAQAPDASAGMGVVPRFTLERCVRFAAQQSRQVRDARLGLQVAGKQVREAWGAVFPTVDLTARYTRNITTPEFFIGDRFVRFALDNQWNSTFVVEQPLFQAQAFIGVGAADRFKRLQTERVRGTLIDVVTEVRQQYLRALLAAESERLTRASIRRIRRTLDGARELEKAGLGRSYDVLRLEVELARLQPELRRAENDRREALRALKVAMGLDVRERMALAGSLYTVDLQHPEDNDPDNLQLLRGVGVPLRDSTDVARLLDLARTRRSDLRQARLDVELSRAQQSAERASVYPKLFGFATWTIDAQEDGGPNFFGENPNQRTSAWQAGVRLELPLLEGGARYSRMAQRRLEVEQRRTRERLLQQRVESEIRTLVARWLEARDRAGSQKLAVAQARRGFEIASNEFRAGLGTQFDALDAEVALRETEFNYAEAVYEFLLSQARLDAAIGVLPWIDSIEEMP